MKVIGLSGWSGAGKTTLLTRVIPYFLSRGLRVSVIKHAHHEFDVDVPGKDSWVHRQSGATEVVVSSTRRWALMHELRGAHEPRLPDAPRAARLDAPAAVHPQVAVQHEPALEAEQEVLPDRLDRLEQPAVELLRQLLHGGTGMRRLDLQPLPDEDLQPRRGARESVALWHASSVVGHALGDRCPPA